MLVLSFLSPAGQRAAGQDRPGTAPHVELTLAVAIDGDALRVSGRTTVPDGAWIVFAARRTGAPDRRALGYARVAGGAYAGVLDIAGWPAGAVTVDAHFQILLPDRRQPASLVALFGRNGEGMTGPAVVQGGAGFRAAIASERLVLP